MRPLHLRALKASSHLLRPARSSTTTALRQSRLPLPTVPTCPLPTCGCAPTPPDLDIDRERPLDNTVAPYSQHLVIFTGQRDWTSRIEEDGIDTGWGELGRGVKRMMSAHEGGEFVDPYNNVLITHSSFPPAKVAVGSKGERTASALLLPSFTYFADLPTKPSSLRLFIRTFLLPTKQNLHKMHDVLPELTRERMIREEDPDVRESFNPRAIAAPVVLICGHGGRDQRCGVMGPLLEKEFVSVFERLNLPVLQAGGLAMEESGYDSDDAPVNLGLISHIGGHKFAGNVIVYLPPRYGLKDGRAGEESPLAGKGIWYGRVEPRHVEGIIRETIMNGRIIEEMFRGGVRPDGKTLRLG